MGARMEMAMQKLEPFGRLAYVRLSNRTSKIEVEFQKRGTIDINQFVPNRFSGPNGVIRSHIPSKRFVE